MEVGMNETTYELSEIFFSIKEMKRRKHTSSFKEIVGKVGATARGKRVVLNASLMPDQP
jgi:hypothetical protein